MMDWEKDLDRMLNSRIREEEECLDDFFLGEDDEFELTEEKKKKPGRPKKVVKEEEFDVLKGLKSLNEAIERLDKI